MEKTKNILHNTEQWFMLIMKQLQIEFPDEHMQKYWEDNNLDLTKSEADHHILGMYNSYYKRRGWHYTRKNENPEHFPIEKHWVWYEPPL